MVEDEEGKEEEQTFFHTDFERKFFSDKTKQIFCKTFFENALKDPITGEIGKSIVFCVSQKHASKVAQILNQFADQLYPGKYNSDFAVQVTSNISDAQGFTISFANNNHNGHIKFLDGYRSSKTRVCVTVGMMTTGYDCEDILNISLMRPIFSPTDFIQIKGHGTRKYNTHQEKEGDEVRKREWLKTSSNSSISLPTANTSRISTITMRFYICRLKRARVVKAVIVNIDEISITQPDP